MKKYLLLFFWLVSFPVNSQNFRLNIGGSYDFFSNINNYQISFYGYSAGYTYYFHKRVGMSLVFNHYFPTTYYGIVRFSSDPEDILPAYITGGGNCLETGLRYKLFAPASKQEIGRASCRVRV